MKIAYKFSNLLGSVYGKGNVVFSPDNDVLLSPVGNKITLFDLKRNKSQTLPVESRFNITTLALSSNGRLLIAVNEDGEAMLISLVSFTIVHKYRFNRLIVAIRFSPDGKYFAVTKGNSAFVYQCPGSASKTYNTFVLERVLQGSYDETTCLCWSSDSRFVAVGSSDMSVRVYPLDKLANFLPMVSLGGHTGGVIGCFFRSDSLDVYTVASNGQLCAWTCNLSSSELVMKTKEQSEKETEESDEEVGAVEEKEEMDEHGKQLPGRDMKTARYTQVMKKFIADEIKSDKRITLTCADFLPATSLLVTGYSNGAFLLHELPDATLIHSLSITEQSISAVTINCSGEWIAVGGSKLGQLLVWEWQSETYIMKQQGHFSAMNCLAFSPNAEYLATGGEDAKVKVWSTTSGFCFVTFSEHSSSVSGIVFTQSGRALLSSSLDGTIRAFDLTRYRSFRTLTSPRPVQFSSIAVDYSGDLVAAGGQDVFEIFLWSLKLGRLLEVLSGHEGPVSDLAFCPSPTSSLLASVSWDKTLRLWDAVEDNLSREVVQLNFDGRAVSFRPDGGEVAVATLDGNITFFDPKTVYQTGSIEGRSDLGSGRSDTDKVTAKTALQGKSFSTLCYSADGQCILAAGQSKHVAIYHVKEQLLVKRFEITQNRSLDAMDDYVNRRKMTEFGNLGLLAERKANEDIHMKLPGAKKGDMAARAFRPEVRVSAVRFSPTGRSWAAVTTEGLLIYSLDDSLVFDPYLLDENVTPQTVRLTLKNKEFLKALTMSLHLNERAVIREVLEGTPSDNVSLVCEWLPQPYVEKLLGYLGGPIMEYSRHIEFCVLWVDSLLTQHTSWLKNRALSILPAVRGLQKTLTRKHDDLAKVCDFNKYQLDYLDRVGALAERRKRSIENETEPLDDEPYFIDVTSGE